jgi:hypothetical protein
MLPDKGVVYVFAISGSSVFSYSYNLRANTVAGGAYFGRSIAALTNTLFISAPGENNGNGELIICCL